MPMPDKKIMKEIIEEIMKEPLVIYTVIYRKYDSLSELHGKLCHVRRSYLEDHISGRRAVDDVCDGVDARLTYRISKRGLKWKKTSGGKVLQRSVREADGYGILTFDRDGSIVSKAVFNSAHQWVRNCYYINDDMVTPQVIIEPGQEENTLVFLEYDKACGEYVKSLRYPCPLEQGTAKQSIINNELGEPDICAATSEGDFCYCTEEECRRRTELVQSITEETEDTAPVWEGPDMSRVAPQEPDFDPHIDLSKYQFEFTPEQVSAQAQDEAPAQTQDSAGQEIAEQEPDESKPAEQDSAEPAEQENSAAPAEDTKENDGQAGRQVESTGVVLMDISPKKLRLAKYETMHLKDVVPSGQPEQPAAYYASREVYQEDRVPGIVANEQETAEQQAAQTPAVQMPQEEILPEQEAQPNKIPEDSTAAVKSVSAAKRIVVSEEESYLYFGRLIDGLRHGRGRTEMENGYTAYDGHYRNDKRDGFGAYYYKSGQICYIGDWKENQRDGVGVSYTPHGENIHIGRWREDKPVGTGAIFDGDGNLSFAGRIENGMRQGAGISYKIEDGTLFVGKWKDNVPTGKGSEFDEDGNLIYTGMWKNGKRNGFGTEYDKEGNIVFTGEWENDRYLDGVLYREGARNEDKPTE